MYCDLERHHSSHVCHCDLVATNDNARDAVTTWKEPSKSICLDKSGMGFSHFPSFRSSVRKTNPSVKSYQPPRRRPVAYWDLHRTKRLANTKVVVCQLHHWLVSGSCINIRKDCRVDLHQGEELLLRQHRANGRRRMGSLVVCQARNSRPRRDVPTPGDIMTYRYQPFDR